MPQRPLDRLLAPGREKQYLFTSFVQYIQRKKSLSNETAARHWVARQLAFPSKSFMSHASVLHPAC